MNARWKIGVVVLTYNSARDFEDCLAGIALQDNIDVNLYVVDNNSQPNEKDAMIRLFTNIFPEGEVIDSITVLSPEHKKIFFLNKENNGYSAGNNIGARLAVAAGCDAVLIINPDVRIANSGYIALLAEFLFSNSQYVVASSSMRNLKGDNENPMPEPSFMEELLWPVSLILNGFHPKNIDKKCMSDKEGISSSSVEKISGSCLMLRSDFLQSIGYFDEGVFLYCEESILSRQVQHHGSKIGYLPSLEALHAHDDKAKGNQFRRYLAWSKSRRYFHKNYSDYGVFKRSILVLSRGLMLGIISLVGFIRSLRENAFFKAYNHWCL